MIRYIISQKGSLAEIREVIGGTIERAYPRESIVIKDESGSQGQNTGKIVEYMEKNPLKTTKWNSFLI